MHFSVRKTNRGREEVKRGRGGIAEGQRVEEKVGEAAKRSRGGKTEEAL